jgi:hypothetical protein
MKKLKSQLSPYSPEGCFIATAVYDTQSYKLELFRNFRKIYIKKVFKIHVLDAVIGSIIN